MRYLEEEEAASTSRGGGQRGARANGRVALLDSDARPPPPPFTLFSQDNPDRPLGDFQVRGDALLRNHKSTEVADLFFSERNVDALQQAIRYRVWVETNGAHTIDRQSDTELTIVMRSLYLQYGRNSPYNVREQVRELNAHVLDYCVPKIMSEMFAYLQYLRDASSLPVPLPNPELATMKGTRSVEFTSTFI